ncbi:MAG TPA: VOC family protein [Propionibacteriaceae bacterium]|nr:VOC family protein [Propionibacteriaceae bacterium]
MSNLTPYICVSDSRAAIEWYRQVFHATVEGEPYIMDDGRVGHVELDIGGSLLMMADPFPEVDVEPPDPSTGNAVSLHLELPDCDMITEAAVRNGAKLDRGPESTPHGRSATFHDPFGHRWMISS